MSSSKKSPTIRVNHVHARVRDIPAALEWLENVLDIRPSFRDERMAAVPFGSFTVIFDRGEEDSILTIGLETDDCDGDFRRAVSRGATPIEPPGDKPWGVRAAYIKGPGALRFEFEQELP